MFKKMKSFVSWSVVAAALAAAPGCAGAWRAPVQYPQATQAAETAGPSETVVTDRPLDRSVALRSALDSLRSALH
jgi:hypothetical protein